MTKFKVGDRVWYNSRLRGYKKQLAVVTRVHETGCAWIEIDNIPENDNFYRGLRGTCDDYCLELLDDNL